jgi:phosphate uptake regulator
MFKELFEALRRRPLLKQMCAELEQMIDDSHGMFRTVEGVLAGRQELNEEVRHTIYETDRSINHTERKIRKQLVEHLTVSPGTDVPISLILMSIIKDAERIGDICKNLLEVTGVLGGPLGDGGYGDRFRQVAAETQELFQPTSDAVRKSDKELGQTVVERARELARTCDSMIRELLEDDLPCRRAVIYTLMARYLKRICSHLSNIATSVVMPLHKLDYFDEKWADSF